MANPWGAIIQAGIGGMSEHAARGERDKARAQLMEALRRFGLIDIPDEAPVDPEQIDRLGPEDPALRGRQDALAAALERMQRDGGLLLEDEAVLNKQLGKAARHEAAGRSAITEQMAARGNLDSGAQLAMSLANQQNSAQQANQNAMDRAAMAQRRALEAIRAGADLAGDMRGQDLRHAQARSQIDQWNAAMRDKARMWNAQAGQRRFDNQMRKAGGQAGMSQAVAGDYNRSAQDTRAFGAGLGKAAYDAFEDEDKKK